MTDRKFGNFVPTSVSPDGTRVVITATGGGAAPDLWVAPLTHNATPTPLLSTPMAERNGEISPDGRWLAYELESGDQTNVWVRPFPEVDSGQWQVSTGGGSQPLWARNGRELFYRDLTGVLMSVAVAPHPTFAFGAATKVLAGPYVNAIPTFAGRLYDISSDGKRFLMLKHAESRPSDTEPHGIVVVQNWQEELKQRVPPR